MTNFITHPFAKMNNRLIVKNHENPQTLGKFQDPSPPFLHSPSMWTS